MFYTIVLQYIHYDRDQSYEELILFLNNKSIYEEPIILINALFLLQELSKERDEPQNKHFLQYLLHAFYQY